jgi:hypothetical protein
MGWKCAPIRHYSASIPPPSARGWRSKMPVQKVPNWMQTMTHYTQLISRKGLTLTPIFARLRPPIDHNIAYMNLQNRVSYISYRNFKNITRARPWGQAQNFLCLFFSARSLTPATRAAAAPLRRPPGPPPASPPAARAAPPPPAAPPPSRSATLLSSINSSIPALPAWDCRGRE